MAFPTTEFEDTNGAEWSSPSNVTQFLETIAADHPDLVTLTQAGTSVEGRPLWRMDMGNNVRGTWMMDSVVHANEWAGREAVLQFLRDTAYGVGSGLILPGAATDYASTPDDPSLDILGDIELIADVTCDQWSSGIIQYMVAKWDFGSNQRSYTLRIEANGDLAFLSSADGSALTVDHTATAPVPVPDGRRIAFRATLDVDNGAGGYTLIFYTAETADGPWTQLGDIITGGSTTSIFNSTADLDVGASNDGSGPFGGVIHEVRVIDSDTGIVANPKFTDIESGTTSFDDDAGRTWTVNGNASITGLGFYLQQHRIVALPDINPDGIANETRQNANGVDINRDGFNLSQPEAQTLVETMADARAHLGLNCHERPQLDPTIQFEYIGCKLLALYEPIRTKAEEFTVLLIDYLNDLGLTHTEYPIPGRRSGREYYGLHHGVGYLFETSNFDDPVQRTGWYLGAIKLMRDWHEAEADNLQQISDASRAYQSETDDQYILQLGDTASGGNWAQVPLPSNLIGYQILEGFPQKYIDAWSIEFNPLNSSQVLLHQEARAVIPILLDQQSGDQQINTFRLLAGDIPIIIATPEQFAPVITGSHRVTFLARVLDTFQIGYNPVGVDIPVIDGNVHYDATADTYSNFELITSGLDNDTFRSLFPRRSTDLFSPYGNEIFLARGVRLSEDLTWWSPLGYFRIDDVDQTGSAKSELRIIGHDRMQQFIETERINPYRYGASRTNQNFANVMIHAAYPEAIVIFDDEDVANETLGRNILVERSRYQALAEVVEGLGKVMYVDGTGIFRIEDAPDPNQVVWEAKSGYHGVLLREGSGRRVSRRDMANGVVAEGEGVSDLPARAVAIDRGLASPTRWGGKFGKIPYFFSSPTLSNDAKAFRAARQTLIRRVGLPYSVDFGTVVNPAIRPRMAIRATHSDGNREKHLVEKITIPLSADAGMTGTTRQQTLVNIGLLSVEELE